MLLKKLNLNEKYNCIHVLDHFHALNSCFGHDGSWIADCSNRNLSLVPTGFSNNTTEIFLQNNYIAQIDNDSFLSLSKLQ